MPVSFLITLVATLAALVLVGVAAWQFHRARRLSTEMLARATHQQILLMAVENDDLRQVWRPHFDSGDPTAQRQHLYTNALISHLAMRWRVGDITEPQLRADAGDILSSEPGQRFWASDQHPRPAVASHKRDEQFLRILNEEYEKATAERRLAPAVSGVVA